jgi:hypothetical protein
LTALLTDRVKVWSGSWPAKAFSGDAGSGGSSGSGWSDEMAKPFLRSNGADVGGLAEASFALKSSSSGGSTCAACSGDGLVREEKREADGAKLPRQAGAGPGGQSAQKAEQT